MSVTINITDPAATSPEELQAVITMLRRFLPQGEGVVIRPFARDAAGQAIRELLAGADEPVDIATKIGVALADPANVSRGDLSYAVREILEEAAPASVFGVPVPPPPPPAEMPVFALVPPAPPVAGADLDKDGIPWDGRIHASTKTKTVEAVWKKKRGIEQAEVDRVVAELRTTMMAPAAPAPVPPAVAQAFASGAASPVVPAPPAPPAAVGITFAAFMGHVTGGVTSGRFTREAVADACAKHGAANLPGLINRPDLIPAVARELGLVV